MFTYFDNCSVAKGWAALAVLAVVFSMAGAAGAQDAVQDDSSETASVAGQWRMMGEKRAVSRSVDASPESWGLIWLWHTGTGETYRVLTTACGFSKYYPMGCLEPVPVIGGPLPAAQDASPGGSGWQVFMFPEDGGWEGENEAFLGNAWLYNTETGVVYRILHGYTFSNFVNAFVQNTCGDTDMCLYRVPTVGETD